MNHRTVLLKDWKKDLLSVRELFLLQIPRGLFRDEPALRFDASPLDRAAALKLRLMRLEGHQDLSRLQVSSLAKPEARSRVGIGSSARAADVILSGERISYRHAEFAPLGWGGRLLDLESIGGCFVEGSRLPIGIPAPVVPGQVIRFGTYEAILLGALQLSGFVSRPAVRTTLKRGRAVWNLPAQGLDLRDFAQRVAKLSKAEFESSRPPSFLLEVPSRARLEDARLDPAAVWANRARARRGAKARIHALPTSQKMRRVGRAEASSDVFIPVKAVSKRHARIDWNGGINRWTLIDLESTNGTFLGSRRLPPGIATAINPGQALSFATYRAVFLQPPQLYELAQTLAN